jgi:hypothetical protein
VVLAHLPGLAAAGLDLPATPPSLGRLAHLRAVAAIRLSLEAGPAWQAGHAHWRSGRDTYNALKLERELSDWASRCSPPTWAPGGTTLAASTAQDTAAPRKDATSRVAMGCQRA